jgi:HPt (histidine-containing phosphotransfer) domain-containing protein
MGFDWKQLSSDLGDDSALAREVAQVLCQSWPALHRRLLTSLALQDDLEKARSLHALKGALGVFPSNEFATKLSSIEKHFRQSECDLALPSLQKVLPEIENYISKLSDLLSKETP